MVYESAENRHFRILLRPSPWAIMAMSPERTGERIGNRSGEPLAVRTNTSPDRCSAVHIGETGSRAGAPQHGQCCDMMADRRYLSLIRSVPHCGKHAALVKESLR